jgi:hypothetical protein
MLSFVADTQVWIRCHDWSHGVLKEMKHGWEKEKHFVRGQNGWNFDNYCGSNVDDNASSYCLTPYTYAASSPLELP